MPPKNSAASTRKKPTAPPPKKAASTTKINQKSTTTAKKNTNNNSEQPGEQQQQQQQQQQQEPYYTGLAGDLIVELKATRRELLELKSKVKNEQDRNGAVIDRIAHLLDKEYRRRRRQEKETLERRAARRRQREEDEEDEEDEEEESDDDDGENAKRKKNQRRTDQDTTSEAEAAQQRKQNRWDFDLPDTLPVTRQNLALYNLVQSLKEAQDSGVCVFRVLDYIRAGIVPSYGDSSDGESCPGGNQKMMPIRTKDGRRQVPLLICDKTNHSGGNANNNGGDDVDGTGRMVYSQQQIDEIKAVARTNAFQELYNMVLQHQDEKKRKEEEEEENQEDGEEVENEE